ncbi:hypothetical protein DPMN_030110 [Dreissena polymorpha]|uniref:Uncharacterized protein n=1 Tax=Dreissena polymorpha TaxID=45954 RepID=A0A9D4RFV7_DREPO|nr:hypothetical protein DPMN_030110 [Dreissena polymorpha]
MHRSKNRSPSLHFRVNFDPPQALREIYGVGFKLARVIVQLRESVGNLDIRTLEVVIRRPLSNSEIDFMDFSENPRLVDEALAKASEGEYVYVSTPYLTQDREAVERVKAELAAQISNLEADITARLVELQVRWPEEVTRDIGVCTDDSTKGSNGKTGGVGAAVPLALPTVQEVVRDIDVFADESTEGGNGETGGVGNAVPLALPTVQEVVRDIGVCTDDGTEGGTQNRGYISQRQVGYPKGAVGGGPRGHRNLRASSCSSTSWRDT